MKYCVDNSYCPYRAPSGVAIICKCKDDCIHQRPQKRNIMQYKTYYPLPSLDPEVRFGTVNNYGREDGS